MKKVYFIILILFISCNISEKGTKKCSKSTTDSRFLKTYNVIVDSCKTFQEYSFFKYLNSNNKVFMEGYSDRYFKQGIWSFYSNKNDEVINGNFQDSQPTGNWSFNNLDSITWKLFYDKELGVKFSYPKSWERYSYSEENSLGFTNSDKAEDQNLSISITWVSLEKITSDFENYYSSLLGRLKNSENISFIREKKIDLEIDIDVYEISYKMNSEDKINYNCKELIYLFNGNIYVLSSIINKKSNHDFQVINEVISTSFKLIDL